MSETAEQRNERLDQARLRAKARVVGQRLGLDPSWPVTAGRIPIVNDPETERYIPLELGYIGRPEDVPANELGAAIQRGIQLARRYGW